MYMDESGFEAKTIRPYGYAPIGKPCIDSYNWQGRKRTNVIGALYEKMLFALDYFEHNINSSIFYDWCKQALIPSLKKMHDRHGYERGSSKALLCPSARGELCSSDTVLQK